MRLLLHLGLAAIVLAGQPYREALPGYQYRFPRDYFEHPDYRTEWWYYTGNVQTAGGRPFGFELVFFRHAQRRGDGNASAWRLDDLYLAHLALTDVGGNRFRYDERLNRAGPGIAGASYNQRRVWNGNWSASWEGGEQVLRAVAEDFRFHLRLRPLKPVVIHGVNGVSQKAAGPGRASHYISLPRLSVSGEIDGQSVNGTAWMDHEWFTHQLGSDQAGWDWFSIQLENGTEYMLFQLRRKDGTIDPHSSGTYIDRRGTAHNLATSDFSLEPLAYWTSPKTGTRYPVRWRIRVPPHELDLECSASIPEQELISKRDAGPTYWEGAVTYSGSARGVGYLEMTGYGKPVRLD